MNKFINEFKNLEIKFETDCQNSVWKRLQNECLKINAHTLPLNAPLNSNKVI